MQPTVIFQNVVSYKNYRLLDNSQTYHEKMAACTGKYAMRMKTSMKAYKFDDKDHVTVFRFQVQFKRFCDSNKISGGMALWIMPTFMKDETATSLTVQMTSHKNDGTTHTLPKEDKEQISTYVEAANFL